MTQQRVARRGRQRGGDQGTSTTTGLATPALCLPAERPRTAATGRLPQCTGTGVTGRSRKPDGTTYYFGLNQLPGYASGDKRLAVRSRCRYTHRDGEPCYNATFPRKCNQAWRWNLDWVTDSHGDAMAYYYNSRDQLLRRRQRDDGDRLLHPGRRPKNIEYGLRSARCTAPRRRRSTSPRLRAAPTSRPAPPGPGVRLRARRAASPRRHSGRSTS